jgi:hypothetical protein
VGSHAIRYDQQMAIALPGGFVFRLNNSEAILVVATAHSDVRRGCYRESILYGF